MSESTGILRVSGGTRFLALLVFLLLGGAPDLHAQNGDPTPFEGGWGSDEALCPRTVGMFTTYQGEQFSGSGKLDRESFFWGRYNFTAHNQGGVGPIEMAGFFYISKAECYLQGGKGVFVIFSPIIEYYGPRRDIADCGGGGDPRLVPEDPEYNPYETGATVASCGSGGGDDGRGGGDNCHQEWLIVERSDDGGNTWYTIWEGWGTVCE